MDLTRGLSHAARAVRTATLAMALAVGTSVVALDQFDRAWGVAPLASESSWWDGDVTPLVRVEAPRR